MLLLGFHSKQTEFSYGVGALCFDKKPLLSQKLPGLQVCDDKHNYSVKYSNSERIIELKFNNSNPIPYYLCEAELTQKRKNKLNFFNSKDAFVRFYFEGKTTRVPIFMNSTSIYTQFHFSFEESPTGNKFKVTPQNPIDVQSSKSLLFSFTTDKYPGGKLASTVQPLSAYLKPLLLSIVFFVFPFLISPPHHWLDIEYRPPEYRNVILFCTVALHLFSSFLLYTPLLEFSTIFQNTHRFIVLGIPFSLLVRVIFGKLNNENLSDPDYVSPTLMIIFTFILPIDCSNVLMSWIGSYRGEKFLPTFLNDAALLLLIFFVCRGAGTVNRNLNIPALFESTKTIYPHKPLPRFWNAVSFLYIFINMMNFSNAVDIVLDSVFNDEQFQTTGYLVTLLYYSSLAWAYGIIRSRYMVSQEGMPWIFQHVGIHMILTLLVILRCLAYLFFFIKARCFSSVVYGIVHIIPQLTIALTFGVGASYGGAWLYLHTKIPKGKIL